jgi:competence protein ComEC
VNKILNNKKLNYLVFGILIFAAILIWLAVFQTHKSNDLKIVFCDVGQGDSELIQKNSDNYLIDGGPDNSVLTCLGNNMPYYDRKIKSVILTHPHADHVTGLVEVLKRYQVGEVWMTGVEYDSAEYAEFKNMIKENNIKTNIAYAGEMIENDPDLTLKILYPINNISGTTPSNPNNSSIVVKMYYHNLTALFTGDIEETVQPELIKNTTELKSDILKVPHHGSGTGLLTQFLSQVNPKVAVIEVGANNNYGHPSSKTLDKLKKIVGIKIYRTDKNGEIKILSNGTNYQVETEK